MRTEHQHASIIDAFGGASEMARIFDITPQAVSQWRTSGIPNARLMYLRLLRPDVFGKSGRNPPINKKEPA